jgi:hypothetical protein
MSSDHTRHGRRGLCSHHYLRWLHGESALPADNHRKPFSAYCQCSEPRWEPVALFNATITLSDVEQCAACGKPPVPADYYSDQ